MSPFSWDSIGGYGDIVNHKSHYIRKYASQLQLYMYMVGKEEALFVLKHKSNGRLKLISVVIDYDYVNTLLKKAQKVNALVEKTRNNGRGIDVEATTDTAICRSCSFCHICFKEQDFGKGISVIDDSEVADKLDRLEQLKPLAEEADEIKEEIGDYFKAKAATEATNGHADFLVGDFAVKLSKVKSTRYSGIPLDIKQQYAEKYEYWKMEPIIKLQS
jgi:hypothetical protein